MSPEEREDLVDALADLRHDLGKYLRLPLAMLPAQATEGELREAARTALLRTRRGPRGASTAAELWAEGRAELEPLDRFDRGAAVVAAVEAALSWVPRLDGPLDRGALQRDLGSVSEAIADLLEEVRHG